MEPVRIDAQGHERFQRTVPVKQQSSKLSVYFQRVAAKTRVADHCQSNNRQARTKEFSFSASPGSPHDGTSKGLPGTCAPFRVELEQIDVQGDERFRRPVPVKQRSSKYSVHFQRVAAKTRVADHCRSNNRQAKARAFSPRHRPDPPASRLTDSCQAVTLARMEPVRIDAQGDERFRRPVPVKQRSSKYSVHFQRVAAKIRVADHCQSNNRQAKAKGFSLSASPGLPTSEAWPPGDRVLPRVGPE